MVTAKEYVMQKVRTMPEDVVRELRDFIDFIENRSEKNDWRWLEKSNDSLREDDFGEYLSGIEKYEDLLAKGKVKWK